MCIYMSMKIFCFLYRSLKGSLLPLPLLALHAMRVFAGVLRLCHSCVSWRARLCARVCTLPFPASGRQQHAGTTTKVERNEHCDDCCGSTLVPKHAMEGFTRLAPTASLFVVLLTTYRGR